MNGFQTERNWQRLKLALWSIEDFKLNFVCYGRQAASQNFTTLPVSESDVAKRFSLLKNNNGHFCLSRRKSLGKLGFNAFPTLKRKMFLELICLFHISDISFCLELGFLTSNWAGNKGRKTKEAQLSFKNKKTSVSILIFFLLVLFLVTSVLYWASLIGRKWEDYVVQSSTWGRTFSVLKINNENAGLMAQISIANK